MNLHEYQAKQLFANYGLPVCKGIVVDDAEKVAGAIAVSYTHLTVPTILLV